ncbi:DDB1- and CUL4-associated factor 11-like [Phaenicophaeus curvirostris]|uniref:DDB1- and CUL4-associated factor 11-like n=1 Tax=Phaenicophaeus curvirostris TaxID=33595 RepID=UPI0037F0DAEA
MGSLWVPIGSLWGLYGVPMGLYSPYRSLFSIGPGGSPGAGSQGGKGRSSCGGAGPHPDHVTRRLQQREWGRSFSAVEQNRLSSRFLPNAEVFAAAYPHKAFCGVFNGDSSLFVSACQDHSLRVYGAAGRGLRLLRSTQGRDVGWSILDVAFTPDGRHGLYCSWSPYVHAFNIHGEDETHMAMDLRPPDRRFALFSLAVGPGGQEVWGGANNGCVYTAASTSTT